ncbi:MAG: Ig-like domain-containing protein, partial [Verrucomicrobiota bacterium]
WMASVTLTPGTNTVQAYAVDTSGNLSTTNTVKFEYVVLKPLTLQIIGLGTVNPKWGTLNPNYTNGTLLAINENYTMTANASSGFAFTNWTDGSANLLTNHATLQFTMVTNLALRANFVDVAKPRVSIVTPTSNQQWTNGGFTVTGKAGDNVAVGTVYYSLNGSGWTAAMTGNNWTNWTASVTLTPGTNTVQAYAVDTSGNLSTTNKVTFAYKTAPNSLAGLMGSVNEDGGGTFYLCFGASTLSQNSGNTNYDNGVGNYSYKQLSPDTAQLSITYTAPPNISGTTTAVLLTFITNNECIFSNQSNVVNTGTISLWSAPNWAPASLNGKTSVLIADGQRTTAAFGAATLTITNAAGQMTNGNYTFKQYSPLGALLTVTQPNETNFMLFTFAATNYGTYYATAYDGSSNAPTLDAGVFAMVSESPGGNAPDSLAGSAALVTQADGSFEMSFGTATFGQNSFTTNYANGVGTCTYTNLGADSAELSFNYTAPPTVANAVAPVTLTFIAPNFCVLTNQDNHGSNIIVAISFWSPPTNWVPTSLAGQTIYATNANGVVDVVTFNGNGTFSQNETGSSNPGVSSGSYTSTPYGPLGGMLVLTYSRGVLAGSVSYIQTTFTGQGMGSLFVTFYDAFADPPVTSFGNFTID